MSTAIIGNGYWSGILRPYITKKFNTKYTVNSKFELRQIWGDSSVDSVFIVTPIETHYELAKEALLHGKHVFVEKPLTTSSKKAKELKRLAEQRNLSIVTDYTYTFSPNLQKEAKKDIEYIEIKLYRNNSDKYANTSVHWVLSCHALSIVNMFMDIKSAKFYMLEPYVGMIIGNGFKIFTSLISPEKVTDIIVADSTFVRTIPIELDNLDRAVEYFYSCIYYNNVSNLDTAIRVTETIERGLRKC
jgi:hypothetical protein